ncbi:MAG: class I SAM-dependent methyltransferase [Tannerella sp.]|nr:class I SAM-dependent methyltransferase [Tannerella sp.]
MQERHLNRDIYFNEQSVTTAKYVIPYIREVKAVDEGTTVLEVGCGEGGNLEPFCRAGCRCVGIDLDGAKIRLGRSRLGPANVSLICRDIYEVDPQELPAFDVIFLRDVIEHIHNQERFIGFIRRFLKDDGVIFFAFPPWRMPFGGHQQIIPNRFLSRLPFFHILPKTLYKWILTGGGVSEDCIASLLEIKQTGISVHRFNRIVRMHQYRVLKKTDWFINPNYEVKFGLKPRKLYVLNRVPFLRDFFTTCYYCIIKP